MTYRALRKGFRVVEVPITFADREVGGSKMSRAIVLEAIWKVPALRPAALRGPAVIAGGRRGRSSSRDVLAAEAGDRRLLGAVVRAVRGGRAASSRSSRRRAASPFVKVNIDAQPGLASRYDVLSLPTVDPLRGGEPRETVTGRSRARRYERAFGPDLDG